MKNILITGGNRGIGLALVENLLSAGNHVFATRRANSAVDHLNELQQAYPERLVLVELNVVDNSQIAAAAKTIGQQTDGLDMLINNAGVLNENNAISTVPYQDVIDSFNINAAAPLMITQHFLPLLKAATASRIINISSSFASLGLRREGMPPRYDYSLSKAALNMLSRALAFELQPDGIIVAAIHPGWVQTDLGGPNAQLTPQESAAGILKTADALTPEQTGMFFAWNGRELAW